MVKMKSIQIENNLDARKNLLLSLFWTNRKTIRTEGCEPFYIKKIVTSTNTYVPEPPKLLKLTDDIFEDIENDIEAGKSVDLEISCGNEYFNASISEDAFSISAQKNEDLEDEIVEKLELEYKRKTPNICMTFYPRVQSQDIGKK
jgi:hypothetical protein